MDKAKKVYQEVYTHSQVIQSNGHQLIKLLLESGIENLQQAQIALKHQCIEGKGEHISKAITIIDGLNACLNHETGGEISTNLEKIYHHMMETLVWANLKNDLEKIEEVIQLLTLIKEGWEGIADDIK